MLNFFRKNTKIVMWTVILLAGMPMLFLFGVDDQVGKGREVSFEAYGHKVSASEMTQEKQMLSRNPRFESVRQPEVLNMIAKANLTRYYKAVSLGVQASDKMVQDYIASIPGIVKDGKIDQKRYKRWIGSMHLSPSAFEEGVRRQLTNYMYMKNISASVRVREDEVREEFKKNNEKADFLSVSFSSIDFTDKVTVKDEDINRYYNSHKNSFRTEEEVKIEYVLTWADDFNKTVVVTDEEIKTHYDNIKDQYFSQTTDGKKSYKPLADVQDKIKEQLSRNKANEAAQKAMDKVRALLATEGAKWADVAKENNVIHETSPFFGSSKVSAQAFGYAPIDFNAATESISEVTSTIQWNKDMKRGYMVYRVLAKKDSIVPKLEDIKDQVKKSLVTDEAKELARTEASAVRNELMKGDFEALAKEKKLTCTTHTEVGFGSLGVDQNLLYNLSEGEVSDVVVIPKSVEAGDPANFKLFKLVKRHPLDDSTFEKEKAGIERSIRNNKERSLQMAFRAEIESDMELGQ